MITTKQFIDIIQPEHSRTSCTDENLYNGFYSGTYYTRCLRCVLLQILKEEKLPKSHTLFADFTIDEQLSKEEEKYR